MHGFAARWLQPVPAAHTDGGDWIFAYHRMKSVNHNNDHFAGDCRWPGSGLCVCLALAAALCLGGCVLPPNVPAPNDSAPVHYRAAQNRQADQHVWPAPGWWHNFGSPELDRLIRQARQSNYDIAAAAARVEQANAQVRVSGAALLPAVGAKASAGKNRSHSITQHDYQVGLNASYELDFWGKNRSALTSAQHSALASRFDRATVALGVEASVATTFFNIVVLKQRLHIARRNLQIARDLLKPLAAGLQAGIGTALDVAQQQAQIAQQRAAIPPLRQQLEHNTDALAVLLGTAPSQLDLTLIKPMKLGIPAIDAGLPSTLLTRRPDIARARAQLLAARADVSHAKAALFPSFDLSAQGGWENAAISGLINPVNGFWSLAASIAQPIFEGGRLRGQLKVSRGRYKELLADYQASLVNAFRDVNDALTDVRQTAEQQKRLQHAVGVATRALSITRAQLHQGVTDVTTVLNTEQALFTARDALASSQLARLQAAVDLYQALGGGWDEDNAVKHGPTKTADRTQQATSGKETQ